MPEPTLFEKIITRDIPAQIEYEDEQCIVIHDIAPKARVHLLIIPKQPIPTVMDLQPTDSALMGHLLLVAKQLGDKLGLTGYKLQCNVGADGGQEIMHIHIHLLAK